MQNAAGMVMASRYEGLPLALLEGLGQGTFAVSTAVGGIKTLPKDLKGLFLVPSSSLRAAFPLNLLHR